MPTPLHWRFLHNSQTDPQGRLVGLMMDGYHTGHELTLACEAFYQDSELPENVNDRMVCDSLFSTFNMSTGPGSNYFGPSMSIGDVIQISEDGITWRAYGVDPVGFEDLGTPELKFLPRPPQWGPKQPA